MAHPAVACAPCVFLLYGSGERSGGSDQAPSGPQPQIGLPWNFGLSAEGRTAGRSSSRGTWFEFLEVV